MPLATAPPRPHAVASPVRSFLQAPVDAAGLVYFRVAFGLIMAWEVVRYFDHGWIGRYYIRPDFLFTFLGFGWVQPWPGDGMYVHFAALGVLALCIAAGYRYRAAAALFFVGFTYVFLLEQAHYLNHFYLICCISLLLPFLPAHRAFSADVRRGAVPPSPTVPAWSLWLLRGQIGLVYFFGGVAKLNADWLAGEPMRMWLARRTDTFLLGPFFTHEPVVFVFTYGGLLLDLLALPALLYARTRVPMTVLLVCFHLLNATLFQIGIFPWFMIATLPLFYPPEQLRALFERLTGRTARPAARLRPSTGPATSLPAWGLGLLGLYAAFQLLLPLRHLAYPGNPSWTEEGHTFAWHMKLREKRATVAFTAVDRRTGAAFTIDPRDYLSPRQLRKMSSRPDLIHQFSRFVAQQYAAVGQPIAVHVDAQASLNGRPRAPLIDPTVDLATQPRTLAPSPWILPLPE